jgi:hypothetical protein
MEAFEIKCCNFVYFILILVLNELLLIKDVLFILYLHVHCPRCAWCFVLRHVFSPGMQTWICATADFGLGSTGQWIGRGEWWNGVFHGFSWYQQNKLALPLIEFAVTVCIFPSRIREFKLYVDVVITTYQMFIWVILLLSNWRYDLQKLLKCPRRYT